MLNRNLLWLLGLGLVAAVFWYFSDIITYIVIAWVLSMLGRPVMIFLQKRIRIGKRHLGEGMAAMLTILLFYAVLAGLVLAFVPTLVEQARNLAGVDYQAVGAKLQEPLNRFDIELHQFGLLQPNEHLAERAQHVIAQWFKPTMLTDMATSFVSAAGGVLVMFASVTFILFFFLKDNELFVDIIHALVPNELEPKVQNAVDESSKVLTAYFGGLLAQTTAFFLTASTLLWLLGVPNALLIGAIGGLFNLVPYVGPIIADIVGCVITISSHLDLPFEVLWPLILKVVAVFVATQFVDNNIVAPLIFSKSVKAHPLEIFLVTLVAAKLGGIVGMVVGIPVYTVLRVVARTFFYKFKIVQRWTEHLDA